MINLIKIFFLILINLIIIVFMTQNSGDRITIHFFNYQLENAYLNVILLFSFIIGIIAGFLSALVVVLSNKSQIRILENKNRILTNELNDLRNVALDEGIYESDDGDY